MLLKNLKYLQLLSGLILTGLYLASPALLPALHPEVFPVVSAANIYTSEPSLIMLLAAAAVNIIVGCYQKPLSGSRRQLQTLGSVALFFSGVLAAISALSRMPVNPVTFYIPLIIVSLLVCGIILHALCNLHQLAAPSATSSESSLDSDREAGTVKWFNVSKGFGFITRDSGDDIFVHYRAIRGEGHRILSEGQRVDFVVTEKEKGLQAEDVATSH